MAEPIKFVAGIDTNPFLSGSQRIVTMMQGLKAEWGNTASSIMGGTAGIASTLGGIAAAIGLVSFKNVVVGAVQGADKLDELAQQSGMTVEALSGLSAVGEIAGVGLDTITAASNKLSYALTKTDEDGAGAAQALKALGLNFGEFVKLSPEDRMMAVAKAMDQFNDGAGKTAVAMALYGKNAAELLPFFNDLVAAGELQARVSTEQAAAAANLSDNWTRLRISGDLWKTSVATAMIPTLDQGLQAVLKMTNATGGLRDDAKKLAADGSVAQWTRDAIKGFSYVADAVQMVVRVFRTVGLAIYGGAMSVVSYFEGVGAAAKEALNMNFSGAAAAMRAGMRGAIEENRDMASKMADIWSEATLGAKFRAAFDALDGKVTLRPIRKDLGTPNLNKPPKEEKPQREKEFSAIGTYEAVLAEEKRVQTLLEAGREYTKEQEVAYWREILATYDVGAKDRTAIVRKMADLEVAILREKAKQREQIDAIGLKAQQDRALAAVELAQQDAQAQLALGDITKAQMLDAERAFEEQRLGIKLDYLRARLAVIDPERDPVAYAQASEAIEEAERQHQQRMAQIRQGAEALRREQSPMLSIWNDAQQAMAQAAGQILTRQQSLAQGLKNIWQGIRQSIAGEITKIAAEWLKGMIRQRVLTMAGIGMKAAEAGAGAAASQASIPIVGPALALAAMGATMAAVLGLGASVPSAARGWDIPAGINPIAQLHEQEMVLPADQANVIRDMAAGGGGGAAQPAAVLRTVGTMGDFLMVHRHDLAKVIKVLNKDSLRG
jgi:hypothetical protein